MKKITSRKALALYGCSGLGVNMLTIMMGSYLCSALLVGGFEEHVESWTYLNKDLVIAGVWAVLVFFAKALDGVIDLPLASFADRLNTRFGRRKTALVLGFIPMIIAYLLFLIPLDNGESLLNTVWFGVLLCIFYTFYTLTMLTYYATFSEVCETERDITFLSNAKSICDVVYFSLGFALIPLFISMEINIRTVALIFLPLSLSMLIPMFLLKENCDENERKTYRTLTLGKSLATSFKDKTFIYWMCTVMVMTVGLQLFLGGINELFSTTGLNMTIVMASSFAPVPFTLMIYNKLTKRFGLGFAYRYVLIMFAIGMVIMHLCTFLSDKIDGGALTAIAIPGGVVVSCAIGAFFSITYTVPSHLAGLQRKRDGKDVSAMYFAVQGLFEGIASGVATGFILVALKDNDCIELLPIVVIITCIIAGAMSLGFDKDVALMGKAEKSK